MPKKKKKEKKPKQRNTQKVDERMKQVLSVEPPEKNIYKMENEDNIDQFMRFGRRKPIRKFVQLTIREQKKFGRRTHRREAPMPWLKKKKSS